MTEALRLHQQALVVDGHCDTILDLYNKKRSFWDYNKKGHLDWHRAKEGGINLQFLAFYLEPQYKPYGALSRVLELLDYFHELQSQGRRMGLDLKTVQSKEDLALLSSQDLAVLLAIEGGEALEGKLSNLRVLHRLGFRSLTLTWNQRNELGDGAGERESRGGLSLFGKDVVREMNRLGMLVDVSHLNEAGFWDVLEISSQPIVASHSCCRTLCDHPRNLRDDQLRALQKNGGVMGVNFYPGFLGEERVTIEKVIEHIEYAACVADVETVGLGSDFDGINRTPIGLESAALLPKLTENLLKRGWREDDVLKVLGGNFLRVLSQVLPQK